MKPSAIKACCYPLILLGLLITLSACRTTGETSRGKNTGDSSDTLAETNVKLGVGYLQQGRNELALAKLQRALELNSSLPSAHSTIAIAYDQVGEYDKAQKHYLKAIRLAPKDSNVHNNYGTFLCKRNELDKAEQQFLLAIENPLYETPAQAYENAGLCALRVPNTIKAEKYFRSALQIDPRLPVSLYQMGVISFDRGDNLSARAYLQRYAAVARHTPQVLWLGVRVERVLGDKNAVSSYALQLRSSFPDSREASLLGESEGRAASLPKQNQ